MLSIETDYWWNGQKRTEISRRGDDWHGMYQTWHPNGGRHILADFVDGVIHGTFQWWYPNGALEVIAVHTHGKRHGLFQSWRIDGTKECEGHFAVGYKQGLWTYNDTGGTYTRLVHYEKGIDVGFQSLAQAQCKTIKEELMATVWHPDRLQAWLEQGYDPDD
jgi:antitoxin component YwqK of YwqJK toxin-antitoxin module